MQAQRAILPGRRAGAGAIVAPVRCRIAPGRVARPLPVLRSAERGPLLVAASAGLSRPAGEENASGSSGAGGAPGLPGFVSVPAAAMGRGGLSISARGGAASDDSNVGSRSALGAVLERNRVNIIMPTPPHQAPKLDDGGDGGGLGKNNHNGGGGGDGGGDDDDDYFGEEGDGEGDGSGGGGGDGFFRLRIPELFDRAALGAVLQEWFKTVADLPLFIRRSVEMGLFSSAQLVRFLSMDVRPGVARAVSRALPTSAAREFVGRLMADPAFTQKLVIEQAIAFAASMLHEWRTRGDAFKAELDLALINSMGLAAAVGAAVWITAPSRAAGAVHKFPWQRMLAGLPHCVFDASGPLRNYTPAARVGGFFASMAQLSAVGAAAGAATSAAAGAAVALRRRADPGFEPSVPVPDVSRASGGLGAFFAINANARYQLLGGMDRYMFGHAAALWSYVAASGLARVAGCAVGELSRPWWQGLATETAASHQRPPRVRKVVRRRVARKPAVAAEEAGAAEGAAAAAAAGVAGAAAAAAALGEFGPAAAGEASGSGSDAAGAAGALEADVEARLAAAPALMGSPEGLQQLARAAAAAASEEGSGGMAEALREAVSEVVA